MTTAKELAAIGLAPHAWRDRRRRCFELAWATLADAYADSDRRLVHGTIRGGLIGQAWLRRGPLIYDPVADAVCRADDYARERNAAEVASYSADEAAQMFVEDGHYGPWTALFVCFVCGRPVGCKGILQGLSMWSGAFVCPAS